MNFEIYLHDSQTEVCMGGVSSLVSYRSANFKLQILIFISC